MSSKDIKNDDAWLMHGDCLERMKEMDDNSVHSVVTDPPYGIGFMGKKWDVGVPALEIFQECLRVLKPGGHLLAFGGARTYHRLAVAVEDAGFEIRDQIMWVYGCLSDDTNIVTPFGEKSYTAIKTGDLVLCYDKYNREYSYQPVEEIYEYNIKDTAYRIQSDHTDQIVSKHHRCLVERDGSEVFIFAEELNTQENIPFLEDLSDLQSAISDAYEGASNKKQDLLEEVFKSKHWDKKFNKETIRSACRHGSSSVLSMYNHVLQKQKTFETCAQPSVFVPMQWSAAWRGMESSCPQGEEKLETRIRTGISGENEWGYKPILEGWDNLQAPERQPQGGEVCPVSERVFENGKEGWVCNGASVDNGPNNRETSYQDRSSPSYKSRSTGQSLGKPNVVHKQQRSQTIRGWSGHKTTLATITPIEYEGKIWCVKVPTGSFVAVRNGKTFTTGNSGFPKSQNVGKAIDKHAGAEREVVGYDASRARPNRKGKVMGEVDYDRSDNGATITAPATEAAKQWDGFGSALKPSHEPIVMARKPLTGTIAANVLEHGSGAINIDGCRVELNGDYKSKPNGRPSQTGLGDNYDPDKANQPDTVGRFPANFIHDGSDEVTELFPHTKSGAMKHEVPSYNGDSHTKFLRGRSGPSNQHGDQGSAARFFYAAKASKKDRGEGNTHPTVKPSSLMEYLCRLVTPPNGTVLDPFMGSGSTGKAAIIEGFKFIGIEKEDEYFAISEKRINEELKFDKD